MFKTLDIFYDFFSFQVFSRWSGFIESKFLYTFLRKGANPEKLKFVDDDKRKIKNLQER
jgi:hypothetical protein